MNFQMSKFLSPFLFTLSTPPTWRQGFVLSHCVLCSLCMLSAESDMGFCVESGARRRPVMQHSASHMQKSERSLLTHLYHSAARSLVVDVIDHVTLQLRAFHIRRIVSKPTIVGLLFKSCRQTRGRCFK